MFNRLFRRSGSRKKEPAEDPQRYGPDAESYSLAHIHVRVADLLRSNANRTYAFMEKSEIKRLFFSGMEPPAEGITGSIIIVTSIGVVDGHSEVISSNEEDLIPVVIFETRNAFRFIDDDRYPRQDGKPHPEGMLSMWMHCHDLGREDLEPMDVSVVQLAPEPEPQRQLRSAPRRALPPSENK